MSRGLGCRLYRPRGSGILFWGVFLLKGSRVPGLGMVEGFRFVLG